MEDKLPCAWLALFSSHLGHAGSATAYEAGNEVAGVFAAVDVAVVEEVESVL